MLVTKQGVWKGFCSVGKMCCSGFQRFLNSAGNWKTRQWPFGTQKIPEGREKEAQPGLPVRLFLSAAL